ncbi:MAG: hypothetical protein QOI80_1640 [Solirubrobacteraceae bacterium]|jgi:hypothetical protein|nr:hypothetical protein [Solirubrobacteraceae bacterium]
MRFRLPAAAVAAFALLVFPAVAAAPKHITPRGVGKVKLHATHASLKAKGVVGRQRAGCNLSGPGARAAKLRAPLEGAVDLTRTKPRRVKSIIVTGGATARGVGIGDRKADIVAAYPKAKFDKSTRKVFGITLVKIPKNGGGRLQMAIDVKTHKVTTFGIPFIEFCE